MIKGLQGEQLKMFMSPNEMSHMALSDFGARSQESLGYESHREVMDHYDDSGRRSKERRMDKTGLRDSVTAEGVKKPITVTHYEHSADVTNGHHRLLAQEDADPDRLMPVAHIGNPGEGNLHNGRTQHATAHPTNNGHEHDPRGSAPQGYTDYSNPKVK